jgi:hypothetical protein
MMGKGTAMSPRTYSTTLSSGDAAETAAKKPYARPTLKGLGSVRELTLGGGTEFLADAKGGMRMTPPSM